MLSACQYSLRSYKYVCKMIDGQNTSYKNETNHTDTPRNKYIHILNTLSFYIYNTCMYNTFIIIIYCFFPRSGLSCRLRDGRNELNMVWSHFAYRQKCCGVWVRGCLRGVCIWCVVRACVYAPRTGISLLFPNVRVFNGYFVELNRKTANAFLTYTNKNISPIRVYFLCDRAHRGADRIGGAQTHISHIVHSFSPKSNAEEEWEKEIEWEMETENPNKFYDSNSFLGYKYIYVFSLFYSGVPSRSTTKWEK